MALRILRKVTPAVINELHDPENRDINKRRDFLYLDKNEPWFDKFYLQADAPRASAITDAILEGTTGFAVWSDEQGGVVKTFHSYKEAAAAVGSARVVMSVDVEVPDAPVVKKGKSSDAELGAAPA